MLFSIELKSPTQQATQAQSQSHLAFIPIQVGAHYIYAQHFEYILYPCEYFHVIIVLVHEEGIAATYQMPVQFFE